MLILPPLGLVSKSYVSHFLVGSREYLNKLDFGRRRVTVFMEFGRKSLWNIRMCQYFFARVSWKERELWD